MVRLDSVGAGTAGLRVRLSSIVLEMAENCQAFIVGAMVGGLSL